MRFNPFVIFKLSSLHTEYKIKNLQKGAIQFFLALMLGLLVVPGYVVAPVLFAVAPTVHEAGNYAGQIFHVTNLAVLVTAALLALCWWRITGGVNRLQWSALLILLLLVAVNAFVVASILADLKAEAGGNISALLPESPQRQLFGRWHGVSAVLHLGASCIAAMLVCLWQGEKKI